MSDHAATPTCCLSRRSFLAGSGALLGGAALTAFRPRVALAADTGADVFVLVFLRGGLDALSAVVPYRDPLYYDRRPGIAIPAERVIDLDGQFGLHPVMGPLADVYRAGKLAVVNGAGHTGLSRSHFQAMDLVDRGLSLDAHTEPGWLARHLARRAAPTGSDLRAVGHNTKLPLSLRGATTAVAMNSLQGFGLLGYGAQDRPRAKAALAALHPAGAGVAGALSAEALHTLSVVEKIEQANPLQYQPRNGAVYPENGLGFRLAQVAQLIRAEDDLALEVACADAQGFDTHSGMGTWDAGFMRELLDGLARALAAFYLDLQDRMDRICVAVISEFGRQVHENGSGGTDHGSGGCMFVMGGGVRGGVYGSWPGLGDASLHGFMGLGITTDFRTVLAEIADKRLGDADLAYTFPGWSGTYLGVVDALA
jgi:uncharacterized protein (DUF1501 family)